MSIVLLEELSLLKSQKSSRITEFVYPRWAIVYGSNQLGIVWSTYYKTCKNQTNFECFDNYDFYKSEFPISVFSSSRFILLESLHVLPCLFTVFGNQLFLKLIVWFPKIVFSQIISILSLTTGPTDRVSLNTNSSFSSFVDFFFIDLIFFKEEINQIYVSNSKINCYIHSEFHGFVSFCDFRVNLPIFQVFLLIRSIFTRAFLPLASSVSWYISNTSLISCNFSKLGKILRSQYPFQVYCFVSPPFQANKR